MCKWLYDLFNVTFITTIVRLGSSVGVVTKLSAGQPRNKHFFGTESVAGFGDFKWPLYNERLFCSGSESELQRIFW